MTKRDTISDELELVKRWAALNNLRLNSDKPRENIILRRRNVLAPEPVDSLRRVPALKILGVTLRSDLRVTPHVEDILASCSGSLHALRILRYHGLPPEALHEVARATTVEE